MKGKSRKLARIASGKDANEVQRKQAIDELTRRRFRDPVARRFLLGCNAS